MPPQASDRRSCPTADRWLAPAARAPTRRFHMHYSGSRPRAHSGSPSMVGMHGSDLDISSVSMAGLRTGVAPD